MQRDRKGKKDIVEPQASDTVGTLLEHFQGHEDSWVMMFISEVQTKKILY